MAVTYLVKRGTGLTAVNLSRETLLVLTMVRARVQRLTAGETGIWGCSVAWEQEDRTQKQSGLQKYSRDKGGRLSSRRSPFEVGC